jgi:hypothetical protein
MSDKITQCNKTLDAEGNVVQYDVAYDVQSDSNKNQFCVTVLASEMSNPTDAEEAKIKANAKAKTIKDAWVSSLPGSTAAPVESIVGDVTLPS